MKKIVLATLICLVLSCNEEPCNSECDNSLTPVVRFEYSRFRCDNTTNTCVQFQNLSEDITERSTFTWSFGDGEQSNDENPVHQFDYYGEFNVALRVTNCNGNISYFSDNIIVSPD